MNGNSETLPDAQGNGHLTEVRDIIADLLKLSPERVESIENFSNELGIDSLIMIELLVRLEQRFGVDISEDRIPGMTSLSAIYELVAERAGWSASTAAQGATE